MKNALYIVVILALFSCRRVLDLAPENSLTYRNGLVNPEDFEAALRGAGQLLLEEVQTTHLSQPVKGEYADDDAPGLFPERFLANWFVKEANWTVHYKIIAQANAVNKFVEQATFETSRKDLYTGQANFYRALAYFELIRQFGDCILVRDEPELTPQPKSSWDSIASYAIQIAEMSAGQLPRFRELRQAGWNGMVNKSVPSSGAANALLAHLYAWKAGCRYMAGDVSYNEQSLWQKAEAAATAVIESGDYRLMPSIDDLVMQSFVGNTDESIYETIFRNQWHEIDPQRHTYPFLVSSYYQNFPVQPFSTPADRATLMIRNISVKAMFAETDERRREYFYLFDEYVKPQYDSLTGGYAYPHKYREIVTSSSGWFAGQMLNFNVNKIWWRLADIILLRSECRARLGDAAGAIGDLNTIRRRAGAPQYDPSEYNGDLRLSIFREREKELLMEGHRYYDVIRNGYGRTELKGGFTSATDQDFRDGAFFLVLPKEGGPLNEYENNPYLTPNKYWSKYY